jgi:FtsZ-interacting cell division protein ZipA
VPDPITIEFEYTDEEAAQATRENWIALARRSFSPATLAIIAASAAIFGAALRARTSLQWLILAGAAPALLFALVIFWAIGLWWAPRAAQKKLARHAHRNVTVQLGDDELTITTANERLALKWVEVRELRELPHYLVLVLATNSEIPMPREAVFPEAKRWLEAKLAIQPPREPSEEAPEKKTEATSEALPAEIPEEEIKEQVEEAPEKAPEETPPEAPADTPPKAAEEPPEKTPEK